MQPEPGLSKVDYNSVSVQWDHEIVALKMLPLFILEALRWQYITCFWRYKDK